MFTKARLRSVSWATWIQYTSSHPISLRSIRLLSCLLHLGLPSGLFPLDFPAKIFYAFLMSPMRSTRTSNFIFVILLLRLYVSVCTYIRKVTLTMCTTIWLSACMFGVPHPPPPKFRTPPSRSNLQFNVINLRLGVATELRGGVFLDYSPGVAIGVQSLGGGG
jgi:hypothetical protein